MKSTYLLVDLNGVIFPWICSLETENTVNIKYMRNMFLTAISNLKIYIKNDAQVVICTEGKSWRKTMNPYYKANRSKSKSKYDWKAIYNIMDQILLEFKENLNWTIINHPDAEADDVIAILSKYIRDETIIVSRDHDSIQLIDDGSPTK
jgi:5'-3' exonuclease